MPRRQNKLNPKNMSTPIPIINKIPINYFKIFYLSKKKKYY